VHAQDCDPFGNAPRGNAYEAFPQLIGGGVDELADLIDGLGSRLPGAAARHHEGTDGLDVAVAALGHAEGTSGQGGPGRFYGIERIGLSLTRPLLAVGSVDFDDDEALSTKVTGEAGSIRARAFHPDQGDLSECAHPATEQLVAGQVGGKGLHAEQSAVGVDHRRHVDICVRIDAARQGALGIYHDCHCRSFSSESVKGWHHRWDGGIVRGRPALTGRPITPPDQWCRVSLGVGRRTTVTPHLSEHGRRVRPKPRGP
jgi:hypothetical protein